MRKLTLSFTMCVVIAVVIYSVTWATCCWDTCEESFTGACDGYQSECPNCTNSSSCLGEKQWAVGDPKMVTLSGGPGDRWFDFTAIVCYRSQSCGTIGYVAGHRCNGIDCSEEHELYNCRGCQAEGASTPHYTDTLYCTSCG